MNKDACSKCCFIRSELKNKLRKELAQIKGKCAYCNKIYVATRINNEKGNYMRIEITEQRKHKQKKQQNKQKTWYRL